MIPVRYSLRSLVVRRGTTAAAALGVGFVAFVVAATLMLADGIQTAMKSAGREDAVIVIRKSADNEFSSSMDEADANVVATEPGLLRGADAPLVSNEVVLVATMARTAGGRGNVQLRGVTDAALLARRDVAFVAGRSPVFGRDEVMIGEQLLGRYEGFTLGGSFELRKGRMLTVVGVFRAGAAYDSEVWLDREALRSAFGREGRISSIYARLDGAGSFDAFRAALESDRRLGLQASRESEFFAAQTDGTAAFIGVMGAMVGLFFGVAAMLGGMNTMLSAVASRQRDIGILRALGFSKLDVLAAVLAESVLIAGVGGALGALLSTALGLVRISMLNLKSRAEIVLGFEPSARVVVIAIGCSLVLGVIGGLLPAFRAARMPAAGAMRA
ncbi:ABC transporter permease [Sorangium sp. So ce119]|uniref:ABC transporter permease n=1 Tax=Sorangium sp. So ce119 TaxID=3133279 RepID=UPI003F618272